MQTSVCRCYIRVIREVNSLGKDIYFREESLLKIHMRTVTINALLHDPIKEYQHDFVGIMNNSNLRYAVAELYPLET